MVGYVLSTNKMDYFLPSDKKILCKSVVTEMILRLGEYKNSPSSIIERCLTSEQDRKDFAKRMRKCKVETRYTNGNPYYVLQGDEFSATYLGDNDGLVVFK